MDPRPEDRAVILAALPAAARRERGGVASLVLERDGRLLDAAVRLDDPPEVWLRPLPTDDPAAVATFVELLERRRAQLAHEISGPATGVLAALETVVDFEPIGGSTRELLEDARAGMLRLTRLVEDRSGLWSGEANVVEEPLGPLLARWVADVRAALDPIGDRFEVSVRAPDEPIRCDASLVHGATAVLLANAWRFRQGQRVRAVVDCAEEGEVMRLAVEDDGRGLDFDTLAQAGTLGYSARPNGVGLGLFSLRWAARRRGGVVVLAPAAHRGIRATVFLPLNNGAAR